MTESTSVCDRLLIPRLRSGQARAARNPVNLGLHYPENRSRQNKGNAEIGNTSEDLLDATTQRFAGVRLLLNPTTPYRERSRVVPTDAVRNPGPAGSS